MKSRRCGRRGRAVSRALWVIIAGFASVAVSASSSRAASGDTFLSEVNGARVGEVTCPEIREWDEPAVVLRPNGARLARNAALDQAAKAYAEAIAKETPGVVTGQAGGYIDATGYLPLAATSDYYKNVVIVDEASIAQDLKANRFACRALFSPDYSEIGIATAQNTRLGQTVFLFVVATRFDQNLIPQYAQAILADVNRVRAQGATCPDGTVYPPKPPLTWSGGLAQVAQQHSEYVANNWDGDVNHLHDNPQGTPDARAMAIGCQTGGIYENVGLPGSLTPAEAWTKLSPGHCGNVMSDRTHAGVGISASHHLVAKNGGGASFITLEVSNVTGACPGTGISTAPTPTSVQNFGTFDAAKFYRISNLGTMPQRALDIRPRNETRSGEDEVAVLPAGSYTGQQWRLSAVPANLFGGQYTRFVRMSTNFRGDGQVLTSTSPPVLRAPIGVADIAQYWLFVPVSGEANTYRIRNSGSTSANWAEGVFLTVRDTGEVGFAWNPKPDDRSTYWKVEPF
jgi:uncharacterized protein YkwD